MLSKNDSRLKRIAIKRNTFIKKIIKKKKKT